jgi:hypothetical protein
MFARFGHINAPVSMTMLHRMSRFGQNSFRENMFAPFGHINAPVSMTMLHFGC